VKGGGLAAAADRPGESKVRLSILAWNQYTDWPSLQALGTTVERLGFDGLWSWDHLYPINGDPSGPTFEAYLTLAGWAAVTERIPLGLMVGANTFRNPALVAKMITTLDHMTGGRIVAGLGGAWFEKEHQDYGIEFGPWIGSRLDWLDEAAMIVRGMLDGARPSGRARYAAHEVVNEPPPLQSHVRIMIGGGGEKKTLATVARYADIWNVDGDLETIRHKDEVLRRWCADVGRDESQIERMLGGGAIVVRRTQAEAQRVVAEIRRVNRGYEDGPELVGSPETVAARLAPYLELGFRHFDFDVPAPFDQETLVLLGSDVRGLLDARLAEIAR
jgi:alkanesulfonate monooxygenase SsuD/methylene tetrahydromethanopterin reductase-like flavin-dependent oxidoreductase (luciferase family)